MIVVIDTSVLLALLDPSTPLPADPDTGLPIKHTPERIAYLIQRLEKSRLIVPTPVLAEILVRTKEATQGYLDALKSQKAISIAPFDQRAAIEAGLMLRDLLATAVPDNQEKRAMKFDIQILAIAKINGADQLISTDGTLLRQAERLGIGAIHLSKLPLPTTPPQLDLVLPDQEENQPQSAFPNATLPKPSIETSEVVEDLSTSLASQPIQATPEPPAQVPPQS